jgi:predicted ribonuclease YlaK
MDLGTKVGVYMTEAQNTTIDLMQLVLQRIGEDCICIIEGDDKTQVDLNVYQDSNNGLKRLSKVFRGEDYYGEVTLKNCHRSRIAERAELMKK